MSATNRGNVRALCDFYATPENVVTKIVDKLELSPGLKVLEPGAGNGNICKVLKENCPRIELTGLEIREEEKETLEGICDNVVITNFLEWETEEKYDVIVGNPPYTYALEFIKKALDRLTDDGKLVLLLRTSFLESKTRHEFWQENPVSALFVLSQRPSFIKGGTDSSSYSWFIWDKKATSQIIGVI